MDGLAPVILSVTGRPPTGSPLRSTSVAVRFCVAPRGFGPAVTGTSVSRPPARRLRTTVVKELENGP